MNNRTQAQINDDLRTRIKLEDYGIENTQSLDFPGAFENYDDSWNFDRFQANFRILVQKCSSDKMDLEFDMIGIDAAVVNSIRRILLAEVPTMAIEKVLFYNNTSLFQDEVLAHRLGLIPLKADPRLFKFRPAAAVAAGSLESNEDDSLEYELKIKCKSQKPTSGNSKQDERENKAFIDSKVLSSHIKWLPIGNQAQKFTGSDVGPIFDDILIAKMNPGQELDLKLIAVKGIGKNHAKFSPVATAFYKLQNDIQLHQEFYDDDAEKLQKCFSPGVIKLVDDHGHKKAVVADPRVDSCSRQIYLHEEFRGKVDMKKIRDHFIFSVESTGALPSDVLVKEAIKILINKTDLYINELNKKR